MKTRREFIQATSLLPFSAVASASATDGASSQEPSPQNDAPTQVKPLPQIPSRNQEEFKQYRLGAKPTIGLLGLQPSSTWDLTKRNLRQELGAAVGTDAAHSQLLNWLDTFDKPFDSRARSIAIDAAKQMHKQGSSTELIYEPLLFESSLRAASALLDRCLRYRNEMGGFETAGIGAALGYLTFIKLRPIQRNLLELSSSVDLAAISQVAEQNAAAEYARAPSLDKHAKGLFQEAVGNVASAETFADKDTLRTKLLRDQFHIGIEAQLAQFTRYLQPGSSSNFAERYIRMLTLLREDLADAYRKLYSAAFGIRKTLGINVIPISGALPPVVIPLFQTDLDVDSWVEKLIPRAASKRVPDILDALVLWTRAISRELDRRSQYDVELTVSIPLNQPWGSNATPIVSTVDIATAFTGGNPTGRVEFSLTNAVLPFAKAIKDVRVNAIGLSVEHSIDDALPLQYTTSFPTPPNQAVTPAAQTAAALAFARTKYSRLNATIESPQQTIAGIGSYKRPPAFLSNVRIQGGSGGDAEALLAFDPCVRNIDPFAGSWAISIDSNALGWYQSAARLPDDWISGLVLHLRLRGAAA